MRAPRALLVVLTAGLVWVATVVLAPPSSAGGPTSVVLVNSATGRAAALLDTDPRYERLVALVGGFDFTPAGVVRLATAEQQRLQAGGGINLTWLLPDGRAFQVVRVYLDAPGGPVLASRFDWAQGVPGVPSGVEPVWHRPSDAKGLAALLYALGLTATSTPPVAASAPATAPAPAAPQQAQSTQQVRSTEPSTTAASTTRAQVAGPLWGLAGALVGAALVLGLGRMRRTQRLDRSDESFAADTDAAPSDVIPSDHDEYAAGTPVPR